MIFLGSIGKVGGELIVLTALYFYDLCDPMHLGAWQSR